MPIRRVRPDNHDDIGLVNRIEILSSGRRAESGPEAIACRRMADPRASIDIVVAETGADKFLDKVGLLIGAARGGDGAHRVLAVFRLNALELGRRIGEGLVPGDFAPGVRDLGANHWFQDPVPVGGVAIGEPPFDAGMAVVRLAVLIGNHAHDFLATHLGLEAAADTAIGASRDRRMFWLADLDHRLFDERGGRASLDTGAAGYALRFEERLRLPRRNPALEAAPADRQGEGALHFLAGANAAVAHDAFGRIEAEIGVGFVLFVGKMVGAVITVAHIAQPDIARLRLQFAISIGRAGEAIERMVGDIKFHHAFAERLQPLGLGINNHARRNRRRAGSRRPGTALDLDEAEPAGAEGFEHVGGAKFWDFGADFHRRPHNGRAFGNTHFNAVDGKRYRFFRP